MIELIEGRGVGAGKSYMVLERLMVHWLRGGTACVSDNVEINWEGCKAYAAKRARVVLEQDQYRKIAAEDLQRLHEVTPPGTGELPVIIVVDEAQDAFNARDWSDKGKRPFFSWLCQSRHDDNDVIILSQSVANVDKQVRRLCTFIWVTRNTEYFPVAGRPLSQWFRLFTLGLSDGRWFVRTQLDQDGRTPLGKTWHKADKGLFGCYESKAMRMKHRRASDAVVKKKLQRVTQKGRYPVLKWVFLAVVVFGAYSGCQLMKGDKKPEPARASQHHRPGPAAKDSEPEYVNGQVIREALRGSGWTSDGKPMLMTAGQGLMVQGDIIRLGRVERVIGNRASVRVSRNVLVYVEAYQGPWEPPIRPKDFGSYARAVSGNR